MAFSVFLVDDEPLLLQRLLRGFEWEKEGFEVLSTFQNSQEALDEIANLKPDLVISDIRMPRIDGLQLMQRAIKESPFTQFVFISGYEEFSYVKKALSLGAAGYCLKPVDDDELSECLERVKEALENQRTLLQYFIGDMLDFNQKESAEKLYQKISVPNAPCAVAASIGDISEELTGFVGFTKVQYDSKNFLYFFDNANYITTIGFAKKIEKLLNENKIGGFKYCCLQGEDSFMENIKNLLNCVHGKFLLKPNNGELLCEKSDNSPSDFASMLEKDYSGQNIGELLQHIANYKQLYQTEKRNIFEVIKIYNIVMATIFLKSDCYFVDDIIKLTDITCQFHNIDEIMTMLAKVLNQKLLRTHNVDLTKLQSETMQKVIEYLHQNFKDSLNFNSLCIMFSVSPSYLSQMFQRELGITFTSYLTQLRINHAKDLLVNSAIPISEIAELCGYTQFCYFSKLFKKQTCYSPSEYRKNKKNPIV